MGGGLYIKVTAQERSEQLFSIPNLRGPRVDQIEKTQLLEESSYENPDLFKSEARLRDSEAWLKADTGGCQRPEAETRRLTHFRKVPGSCTATGNLPRG